MCKHQNQASQFYGESISTGIFLLHAFSSASIVFNPMPGAFDTINLKPMYFLSNSTQQETLW